MMFRFPWLLALLILVPLMVFLKYWKRRRPFVLFSNARTLARLPRSWAIYLSWLLPVFQLLGLALLVIAIARPQRGLDESRVLTEAVDIILLVDVSPSMEAIDLSSNRKILNRLDAAKTVIGKFIEDRKEDRVGMVAFAAYPYTVSPLTTDHNWLVEQMKRLSTDILQDGSDNLTAIGTGLGYSVNRLRESKAVSKIIVLLTDGVNNSGNLSPINAALAAEAMGIKVYTVGAGASGMVKVPMKDPRGNVIKVGNKIRTRQFYSEIDEETLQQIAETTGAKYFKADNFTMLKDVFEEIDELEKTEIEIEQYTRFEELFMPFALASL
ncbi:MAG: VWA domain-containing protein, partial [Verrucomicrobiota bacterium]